MQEPPIDWRGNAISQSRAFFSAIRTVIKAALSVTRNTHRPHASAAGKLSPSNTQDMSAHS
jgi:hypothetical protein